ncbi:S41 family peptidase [Caulobacter sp. 17J80-11]|uniref:S41 family peptidase n=1 Tax=Caulobacter sp. 17J80-11 TaxID=2763502 RepID=UPI0016537E0D|nr:S41 family peptidase [Caulobacter sp. 17J80-11]MBC6980886.1 S41 family peptidase [Caulobacter sp. 17J80-11]
MRRLLLAAGSALITACAAVPAPAQTVSAPPAASAPAQPLDAAERRQVVEQLAAKLDSDFVFAEVGSRYAATLRSHLAAGAYDGLSDPAAFGDKVTADLQAVSRDGHLRLAPMSAFTAPRPAPAAVAAAPVSTRPSGPPGMEEAKMIGEVAYLRFNMFPQDPAVADAARAFLLAHADAKGVIIDARPHRGGGFEVMNAILPLLYPERTALVRLETRAGPEAEDPVVDGKYFIQRPSAPTVVVCDHVVTPDKAEARLQHVPVYYLTSGKTASAGEHLALAFKRTHRATLIGETTRGAGHSGSLQPIGDRFAAFIPVGRTFDPDTGWDWEGKGVAPDVAVAADQALDEALKRLTAAGVKTS